MLLVQSVELLLTLHTLPSASHARKAATNLKKVPQRASTVSLEKNSRNPCKQSVKNVLSTRTRVLPKRVTAKHVTQVRTHCSGAAHHASLAAREVLVMGSMGAKSVLWDGQDRPTTKI